jgi:hypothetical protein
MATRYPSMLPIVRELAAVHASGTAVRHLAASHSRVRVPSPVSLQFASEVNTCVVPVAVGSYVRPLVLLDASVAVTVNVVAPAPIVLVPMK